VTRAAAAWQRFWFAPEPTSTLALVRIAVGLLSLAWALSLRSDLFALYASDGVLHAQPDAPGAWGLLAVADGDVALVCAYVALLAGAVALTLGLYTRLAALVVFVGLLSFARRNPYAVNDGDALLRLLVLYLMLSPAGAALSLDRLRRGREGAWEFPARAPWALRLIQLQLSLVYLSTVAQRLRGDHWTDGSAVSYVLRLEELQRLPLPAGLAADAGAMAVATYGTLALELALAILVWHRRTLPWALGLGVALHLAIEYALRVGFFSFAVLACYLAFLPPATATAWIGAVRRRLCPAAPAVSPDASRAAR